MFDKKLFLQHLNKGVPLQEARRLKPFGVSAKLHTTLVHHISKKYGIDPEHKGWQHVPFAQRGFDRHASSTQHQANLQQFGDGVYDQFDRHVENHHMENNPEQSHGGRGFQGSAAEEEMAVEAKEGLHDHISKVATHHEIKSKRQPEHLTDTERREMEWDRAGGREEYQQPRNDGPVWPP